MVPEPAGLPPESTPVRPPPIPHQDSASAGGFTPPSWASAQYQSMNAFPQGYPPSTPYHPAQQAFTPYQQPGSHDGQAGSPTRMFSRYQEEEEEEEEEDEEEGEEVRKSAQPTSH